MINNRARAYWMPSMSTMPAHMLNVFKTEKERSMDTQSEINILSTEEFKLYSAQLSPEEVERCIRILEEIYSQRVTCQKDVCSKTPFSLL